MEYTKGMELKHNRTGRMVSVISVNNGSCVIRQETGDERQFSAATLDRLYIPVTPPAKQVTRRAPARGARMTKTFIIRLDDETQRKFSEICDYQDRGRADMIRHLIRQEWAFLKNGGQL